MIKGVAFLALVFLLMLTSPSLSFGTESPGRVYPFPVVEVQRILLRWLVDSAFDVSTASLGDDQVRIKGVRGNESWEMTIQAHSPLASFLRIKYTVGGQLQEAKIDELWTYLEAYAKGGISEKKELGQEVPTEVRSQGQSVVCVSAKMENEEIRFSGFVVDKRGLIVSTAHDLKAVQEISVILHNGQRIRGNLVKMDPHRDLILIDINFRVNDSISLKGRSRLKNGERIYSISCPQMVHSGVIDGPPRKVEDLPLWQVDMETLPGGSGGPVFDIRGNLVAMVKGRYRGTDSIGFLIPLVTLVDFLKGK